ncbi:MAG: helicase-related protein [Candidatus Bipolaricaulia bacterium]
MSEKVPTIVDNTGELTVLQVLSRILPQTAYLDIATGYFEVSSLLALGEAWSNIERIRILMGDATTRKTRQLLVEELSRKTEESLENHKERDDSLTGLDRVRQALQQKQIQVRVYDRSKFHAKCYLMRTRPPQLVNLGLIGSSNFTESGLTSNIELNLLTSEQHQLRALWEWFEQAWKEAKEVNADVLKVIERHLQLFTPFEIWAKALYEYFLGREKPVTHWEEHESVVYPLLSKYQQDGYRMALRIAERWGGALICDGVGLGKTFIGLMLLEYHFKRGDRILLLVPKSARASVWESAIDRYLRPQYRVDCTAHLHIHNHTDFGREGTIPQEELEFYQEHCKVIVVDEAHHFRTPSANRSKVLRTLCTGGAQKLLYFLTATPINNSLRDLYHLINYIARDDPKYFTALGIQSLSRYFSEAEMRLEEAFLNTGADVAAAVQDTDLLRTDPLLKALVIQRSRSYVRETESQNSNTPVFPEREKPRVIEYSLKRVYAGLYSELRTAFDRDDPLLTLAIYNPERFRKGKPDEQVLNRDRQVIGLIRTLLLKRLESSYKAFEASLEDLLCKMAAFVERYAPQRWQAWHTQNARIWKAIQQHYLERCALDEPDSEEEEGDELDDIAVAQLPAAPDEYNLDALLTAIESDMTLLADMLGRVYQHLSPQSDDKLAQLLKVLAEDPLLQREKVVIFTEFRDTARYLWKELQARGFTHVEELDSTRKINREAVIKRFAPYYNCDDEELPLYANDQIRVLISTDVLSEGLNLQDARLIINYDLHWNPVRLMQRIGRVDRRLNPEIERRLGRSQPVKVYVYNFLPPDELDELLGLYRRVTGKLVRISKTLGIEAPVLTPEDEFEALRLFNEKYEGQRSIEEELHLELERLKREHPGLFERLSSYPKRIFSGKQANPDGIRGLFCCYRFPVVAKEGEGGKEPSLGEIRWYFRVAETGEIWESDRLTEIAEAIRCLPDTPRVVKTSAQVLKSWREEIERGPVARHLRALQTPIGVKPTLVCWMEVC